jgi:peptide/nickel transport system substrate-binding protein
MKRALAAALHGILVLVLASACRERPGAAAPASASPSPAASATPEPEPPRLGFLDESREATPVDGGTLRRRLTGEPTTLNAVLQSSGPEAQVLQYVQRNLFDYDASLQLVPGLAQEMQASPDGLEYTITLRPDAVWEDGRPVTAKDAVFTIRKIADPKVQAPVFKPLFEEMSAIEILDAHRFRVRFSRPYAFRPMCFVLPILPAHRFEGQNFLKSKENRAPLSNGPYRVVSWKAQESVVLERNPRYSGPRGHFDRIEFRIVPDNTTAYRMLLDGSLDEDVVDSGIKQRAASDPAFETCCRLVEFYNLDYNYIALNDRSPFFSDARVRRAMTMMLDRASIVRSLYRGSARIISGPWAPDSPAYDAEVAPLPFDPAMAARLLDEAGWVRPAGGGPREKDGRRFEFDLFVSAGSEVGRQIDEMLASELAKVGVTANVRAMEWAAFVEKVDAGDFAAASLAWSAVDPNPDPYFYWHSSQCAPAGINDGCYANPAADVLMVQAREEMDSGRRLETLHRLHRLLRDEAPAIFVVNASQKYAFRKRVRGLTTSPLGLYGIWPGPLAWWAAPEAAAQR